ncbi:pulmonary surfactant-associated protein D-like [Pantherophis guttatus]|uniref:Pulmonary surfactant-associated protein D-like n=1 Tax=Pantherophis guttatus TaxID=94885 RepID=A0A6P9C9H0_PANGU|nr:pulmonary surfactant-associated protein D-like [Pantherophis guttatus]
MMGLSSRPCIPTMLTFLMLLQLAFKVSLQEGPNREDPRIQKLIEVLDHLKLQIKELQDVMIQFKGTTINILKVLLGPGGEIVDGKIFRTQKNRGTFQDGKSGCENNLALPRNDAENKALQNILVQPGQKAVLGITYNAAENIFVDLTGQPITYSKWARGEPNVLGKNKGVMINENGEWQIEDRELDSWTIICEISI